MEQLFNEYRTAVTAVEARLTALQEEQKSARGEEYISLVRRIAALEDEREDLYFALRGMAGYLPGG